MFKRKLTPTQQIALTTRLRGDQVQKAWDLLSKYIRSKHYIEQLIRRMEEKSRSTPIHFSDYVDLYEMYINGGYPEDILIMVQQQELLES